MLILEFALICLFVTKLLLFALGGFGLWLLVCLMVAGWTLILVVCFGFYFCLLVLIDCGFGWVYGVDCLMFLVVCYYL